MIFAVVIHRTAVTVCGLLSQVADLYYVLRNSNLYLVEHEINKKLLVRYFFSIYLILGVMLLVYKVIQ